MHGDAQLLVPACHGVGVEEEADDPEEMGAQRDVALGLVKVEVDDVGKRVFLRIDDAEAQSLLVSAQQELNAGLATRVMIIEDEPVIALDLRAIVENAGHSVTGVARTRDQAVALAQKSPPGLVLADIQLADDSSGIDAVKDILDEMNVPVIFITAYPERLLTGEKPEPTYLVTKPFMPETVSATISQALFFFERKSVAAE